MKKLLIIFAVALGIAVTAGLLLRQDKPIDKPAGAITLWYLDGTVLRPVDSGWSAEITSLGDGTNSNIPFVTIGNTASLSFERALTGTANQLTVTDGGANGAVTLSVPSLFSITAASISSKFEVVGVASISAFRLPLTTGGTLGDCDAAGDTLNWDSTTGKFVCGTDATGTFDSTVVGATTWGAGGNASNIWSFDLSGTDPTFTIRNNGFSIGGTASVSSNFEIGGTASASFFNGSAFPATSCASSGNALRWSTTGLFTCATLADADIPNTISIIGGTIGANNISGTQTTTATLTIGDNGDAIVFDASNWDISSAGVANFNAVGSHSFGGSLSGPTTGTLSVGTSNNPLKVLWSNIVRAVVSFFFPTTTSTVPTVAGEAIVNTASASLEVYTGAFNSILTAKKCFTYVVDAPTAANPGKVGPIRFNDPFTITSVQPVASGSSAAGWNLIYGAPGTLTTSVFTANKSASTSAYPTYTSFANSTLTDGQAMALSITSRSAVLKTFSVSVCGRYTK